MVKLPEPRGVIQHYLYYLCTQGIGDGGAMEGNIFTDELKTKLEELENYTLPNASDKVLGGIKVAASDPNLKITNGVLACKKNIPDAYVLPKLDNIAALSPDADAATIVTAFNSLLTDLIAKGYMNQSV